MWLYVYQSYRRTRYAYQFRLRRVTQQREWGTLVVLMMLSKSCEIRQSDVINADNKTNVLLLQITALKYEQHVA